MKSVSQYGLTLAASYFISITGSANADYVGSILANKNDIKSVLINNSKKPVKESGYSPYAGINYPTKVLWDDTHLHTNLSLDAHAFGVVLGPAFARSVKVGNIVDMKNASWTNTISVSELISACKNPDFNSEQRAYTSPIWYTPITHTKLEISIV